MTHKTQPTAHAEITAPISAELRRIDDAGAQPAPAQLQKTLRELAEVVHDWGTRDQAWAHPDPDCFDVALFGHISEDGEPYPVAEVNADTYGHEGVSLQLAQFYAAASPAAVLALLDRVELRDNELKAARADIKHWRSNHDNVVARLRIFTQRPDIPKELADRLPWYRELVRLQAVESQALQQNAEITDAEIDRIAESMPGGLDGFLKAWGWRQFAREILQAAPPAPAAANYSGLLNSCAPAAVAVPPLTPDEARRAARTADLMRGPSDTTQPAAYAMAGALALAAKLAAAPAQVWPSECDSPELCQVHRGCAGQYGTKNTCPSFAVLNPCNPAAPAQAVAEPVEVDLPDVEDMAHSAVQEALSYGVSHDVFHRWMRSVMDKTVQALAAAPAQAVAVPAMPPTDDRRPYYEDQPEGYLESDDEWIGRNLEAVRWLSDNHAAVRAALTPAQEHATQLAGQGPTPEELIALSRECTKMPGGQGMHYLNYARAVLARWRAAPAQAQEDARAVEPDMFWNMDEPESEHGSIEEFLSDEVSNGLLEVGTVFTMLCACKSPNITIRVTKVDHDECEAEYEVIDAARAAQGGAA